MNILILGSGGREHVLAWKVAQSRHCNKLYILPGNAGTEQLGTSVDIPLTDFDGILTFSLDNNIEIIVVGPEQPLVGGIVDYFANSGIFVVGPDRSGAMLEGSKSFAKSFMQEYGIPSAAYRAFDASTLSEGLEFLSVNSPPFVLKADGLAAGKGVLILDSLEKAKIELIAMLEGKFGTASRQVVIEEFLSGREFSVFVLTDGTDYLTLPVAKDYKRMGEGDTGLNTGGMGAVSPVKFVDDAMMKKVKTRIVEPTIRGIQARQMRYQGFIFFGLIAVNGDPFVIEYNCRLGDPETQVVIPRIKNDLLEIFIHLKKNTLTAVNLEIDDRAACTVVLASGGYPQSYAKGMPINGFAELTDSLVFHAGTKKVGDHIVTNGGRVLALTSFGVTTESALEKSRKNAQIIDFSGKYYRRDIGFDL